MSKSQKILARILSGVSDQNISFEDLCSLLSRLGFELRIRGSHHIFHRQDVDEILNLQSNAGKAKAYQVKQVRLVILKYKLGGNDDE
jgi:hypothetical protein